MGNIEVNQRIFQTEMLPHMPVLYYFALRKTRDRDDARDLLQDTYYNAYRSIEKFSSGTNAKAWLFRIMINSMINRYRKKTREPEQVSYDGVEEPCFSVTWYSSQFNDLQHEIIESQFNDEVSRALGNLPDDYRTIIILSDIEGYTYEEIADFYQIPIGTVRSRLHRARKHLRMMLKEYALHHGYRLVLNEEETKSDEHC